MVLLVVFVCCIVCCWKGQEWMATLANVQEEKGRLVVIDAGHGGMDPGKIGVNQVLEKDINLQIAKRVKTLLEQNDVKVVMVREDDQGLYDESASNKKVQDMKRRMEVIEKSDAVLAVSIHQNSYQEEYVCGPQVFYYTTSEEGKTAAFLMQAQLAEGLEQEKKREAKANNSYYLLKKSTIPTIIVECGFLSNYAEAERLKTEAYQEQVAFQITMGILKYLNQE
ncbi:MAG: N-acetylmuramoyl-L-alanine amidase [Lachnospiraceae bacterium]|nr:N-acetylmuramoyl-L-alanine amidase [Lachnospiraceae bacterium]